MDSDCSAVASDYMALKVAVDIYCSEKMASRPMSWKTGTGDNEVRLTFLPIFLISQEKNTSKKTGLH